MLRIVFVQIRITLLLLLRRLLVQESSRGRSRLNFFDDRFDQMYFLFHGRVGMTIVRVHRCEHGPEVGVPRIHHSSSIGTSLQGNVIAVAATTYDIMFLDVLFRNQNRRSSTNTLLWRSCCIVRSSSRRVLPFPRSLRTSSGTSSTGTILLHVIEIRRRGGGGRRGRHTGTCRLEKIKYS